MFEKGGERKGPFTLPVQWAVQLLHRKKYRLKRDLPELTHASHLRNRVHERTQIMQAFCTWEDLQKEGFLHPKDHPLVNICKGDNAKANL